MRVAVIGTGIAGNAAAWTLTKHYPVTVYDRESRPCGHSHTVTIDYEGTPLAVDVGFIVYKPTNMTLGKLFPQHIPSQKVVDPVYLGGPTGAEVIFAMVKDKKSPGGRSLQLAPGLFLAYDSAVVDRIIETQPEQARFFAGMVMWQPHELADEVKRGLWYVLPAKPEILLRKPTDSLWEDLVGRCEREANTI